MNRRVVVMGMIVALATWGCGQAGGSASVVTPTTSSNEPSAAPSELTGPVVEISADSHRFDRAVLDVPAGQAFHIVFTNDELLTPHNIEIEDAQGEEVFFGKPFEGDDTRTYDVPALPAGTYGFLCTVHPEMRGTMTAG